MSQLAEQIRHVCALGAFHSVLAIDRCIPILHAGPGCGQKAWGAMGMGNGCQGSGYAGGHSVPCTNVSEKEIIFGGEEKLRQLIGNALEVIDGDLFVVLTGCTSDIVGDDVGEVVRNFQNRGKPVIYAETGGFKGTNYYGHELVLQAIIEQYLREVESVVTGSTDVFTNHADTVVKYILGGAKIKIVAPGIVDSPKFHHMDYLSSANGPKSWQDFLTHKYKVGMSGTDTCSDLILYKWLASHNIPQSQVDIVVLPDPQLEEALKLGQVDVVCFHPPFNQTALVDGFKELFSSYDVVQGPAGGASIRGFSDKFIQEHPDVVAGFTVAIVRAHHWINAHQQQAIQMNADYLKVAPQNLGIFWYDDTNWVQDSYMQWWVSSMKEVGQLKPGQDIQASDIYTNAYNPYYTHQDTTTSWDKPSWDQQ
jgi:ABC-type nitrate/sulfonate/bicarbonate transport system substrate-binding protein